MADIKERIIDKLNQIEDPNLLKELLKAVELEVEVDQTYDLTKEEKTAIDEGIAAAESGNTNSSKEANQSVREWLKEQL